MCVCIHSAICFFVTFSLRNAVIATRLQAIARCCLLSRAHSRVLGLRAAAAAALGARVKRAVANRWERVNVCVCGGGGLRMGDALM